MKEQWVIPPEANSEFVWHMEDVLEVYTRPYDERYPQVCVDETSKQLVGETRIPLPVKPGQTEKVDYEYHARDETSVPAESRRILDRLEIHHTPKHNSWLNIAEIELSILSRQCLDRRISDKAELTAEVAAWEARRNALGGRVNWRFTAKDARIKLKTLYPPIEE